MVKISISYEGDLLTRSIHESGEELFTDAPRDNGGQGKHFSPTDLVATALGTCVLTLMGMAAKRVGIDLKGAHLVVTKEMKREPVRMLAKLDIVFFFPHSIDAASQEKIERAAMTCPVHASLHPDIKQIFTFHWGTRPA